MATFNTSKVNGNEVSADEWNQFVEFTNLFNGTGQTPSSGNLQQAGISAARYSSGGQFFTDSGTANAYVLSSVSPFQAPVASGLTYFNGMMIRFRAGNANTGASTVNVNGAGVVNLKKEDGTTDLTAGDIQTNSDVQFRYNGTAFARISGTSTITSRGFSYFPKPITIVNNATTPNTDIDFSAGNYNFSDGSGQAVATAMTKRLQSSGSWSAGAAGNMLLTGARANSSTYHLYAIYNPTSRASDFGALLGVAGTAPDPTSALPSGYTKFKRIGSILTDGSGNIRAFTQFANYFKYTSGVVDLNTTFVAGSTTPSVSTPLGINTLGIFNIGLDISTGSTGNNIWSVISDFNQASSLGITSNRQATVNVAKISSFTNIASTPAAAFTNLSSQVRIFNNEVVASTTSASIGLLTHGFIDTNL
jgi:hypothetical protein